jgi:hypothetical protein
VASKEAAKPKKEPDYSKMRVFPNRLAEFAQMQSGLSADELAKLFGALSKVNEKVTVSRRRPVPGKTISKVVGGKERKMTVIKAADYEQKRFESKSEKDKKIDELLDLEAEPLVPHEAVSDSVYPQRLAPNDIARYTETADEKLQALDLARSRTSPIFAPREETIIDIMFLIKKHEALRVAKKIAERQRAGVLNKTLEELEADYAEWLRKLRGDPPPETEEEKAARLVKEEEERIAEEARAAEEAAKNFNELPSVFTLIDDVALMIAENPDAAASVVRQWVGEAVLLGGGTGTPQQ